MVSAIAARQALRLPSRLRLFSTTVARDVKVKRLGVVGAGQMVSSPKYFKVYSLGTG